MPCNPYNRANRMGKVSVYPIGAALSPSLAGILLGVPTLISLPFFLCGGLKIIYDLALWREFSAVKPPEEQRS